MALRLAGPPVGPDDTAIAGHAIATGTILVTNNVSGFERVPGLTLENWAKQYGSYTVLMAVRLVPEEKTDLTPASFFSGSNVV